VLFRSQRIASQFPVYFEPSILASYRLHPSSATSRLRVDATDTRDIREMIDLTMSYHTPARARVFARKARSWWAQAAVFHARELLVKIGFSAAWPQIVEAVRLSYDWRVIQKVFSFFVLWLRIMGSRVKCWVRSKLNTPTEGQHRK